MATNAQVDRARSAAKGARGKAAEIAKSYRDKFRVLKAKKETAVYMEGVGASVSFVSGAALGGVARGLLGDTIMETKVPTDLVAGTLFVILGAGGAFFIHPALRYLAYAGLGMGAPWLSDMSAWGTMRASTMIKDRMAGGEAGPTPVQVAA